MDPDNPVVNLCAQGMRAESEGRNADARDLFERAWQTAADDYEACVAAHYLARHQPTPQQTLHWNQECLNRADLVGDERVSGFHASLHINMAKAYGDLAEPGKAREHFELAAAHVDAVPSGQYGDWMRVAVAEGLRATGATEARAVDGLLRALFVKFCARGDLKALGLVLPAYLTDLGTEDDRMRLVTALQMVHAAGWLPEEERQILSNAIGVL
ncbi:hypothetical protein [Streptomyces sp. NL15-2K]|uniref:hypothetical protein n=1 Tax=Streptomyces sp. NL15-2K TaxID=376149 RepID=UPI000F5792FD|nr:MULTISPECIES: hypothetical protein [Actinomycetes]WKX10850.1 hypothetical protein Q4V64_26445 [Kutzneria buriramensis]GCB47591.1 hypothetical protein SNL152K_4896 [Streptomyces sp. NL15-2K]